MIITRKRDRAFPRMLTQTLPKGEVCGGECTQHDTAGSRGHVGVGMFGVSPSQHGCPFIEVVYYFHVPIQRIVKYIFMCVCVCVCVYVCVCVCVRERERERERDVRVCGHRHNECTMIPRRFVQATPNIVEQHGKEQGGATRTVLPLLAWQCGVADHRS